MAIGHRVEQGPRLSFTPCFEYDTTGLEGKAVMSEDAAVAIGSPGREARVSYVRPHLRNLGDLRVLTLGGSPGSGDSGAPTAQNIPGPPI